MTISCDHISFIITSGKVFVDDLHFLSVKVATLVRDSYVVLRVLNPYK